MIALQIGKVNGHTTNFTAINLREGQHHYFAVHAVNKNGKSAAADTTRPVVPKRIISEYSLRSSAKPQSNCSFHADLFHQVFSHTPFVPNIAVPCVQKQEI